MKGGPTALVTGAAGFLGSHLCERLVAERWQVRGVDCFTNTYEVALKERNLGKLYNEPRFTLERIDLRTAELAPLLRGVQIVWHLAAQAGVRSSWGREFETYTSINVGATQRLLEAVVSGGDISLDRLVYASSSSVYGEAPAFPAAEDGPCLPISPYGVTKLAGEHLVRLYARSYQLPAVSLRYFTVYGPRQRPDMAFHRFLQALHADQPIPIYGDGMQIRDFTYVDDITEANWLARTNGRTGGSYNVSGGSQASVLEVIETLERLSGKKARRQFLPAQKGDPRRTGGDSTRAREELGYSPSVDLGTGLGRMVAWMELYLSRSPE